MMTKQLLAAAALLAIASSFAAAQVRQLDMGASMDANPQVGGGGSNRPVPGFVPINQNDVMTGNVSGLSYFHGRVGSSSPYQSRSGFANDPLANFARQSAGTPTNGAYTGVTQTYYLPSATVSTAGGSLYSSPVGSGFDSALVPRASISPAATASQLNALNGGMGADYQAINRSLNANPLQAGQPGNVLANPLFVLRTTEQSAKNSDLAHPTTLPNGMPNPNLPLNNGAGLNPDGTPATRPVDPDLVQGLVGGNRDPRVAGQSVEFKSALVSDTYLQLADQLNKVQGATPGAENDPSTQPADNALPNRSGMDIDPLTGKPRLIATLPNFTSRGGRPAATTQSAMSLRTNLPTPKRLNEVSDAELLAGSKIKPVHIAQSAGGAISGFDLQMSRAESNLKVGRYLDAAESFQSALTMKPDDPLALVGRAHAEMGAGIYIAAEYDLKFVFTRKPELVSVRYDVNSFLPANRQEFLLEDFHKLTTNKETANMASFLYCYLCYQSGRTAQLKSELQAWSARDARDDWQSIAQRAWSAK